MTVYISEGAELLPWADESWLREAHGWIDACLDELAVRRTGEITPIYARSWSTVLRVPTDEGALFFKASSPTQAAEVPLVKALAAWTPDVVPPLASDEERAWMLMRDGGTRLRELPAGTEVATWQSIVSRYARLQLAAASHVDELLALGVRDLRLAQIPDRLADLLADEELLLVGREGGLTREEHGRLTDWLPDLRDLCIRLASFGIPETIEHNDLHGANILFARGRFSFFDWGDASISHPFHTLRVTLWVVADTLGVAEGDPPLLAIRDAYLSEFGEPPALAEPFELAQRTAVVANVLTWAPYVTAMIPAFRQRYERSVAEDARRILDVI